LYYSLLENEKELKKQTKNKMAKKETDKPAAKKGTVKKPAVKKAVAKSAVVKAEMKLSKKAPDKKLAPIQEEPKTSRFSAFFKEFKENVSEGAKALANISSDLLEDAKEKAEDLYGKGSEKFEQASGVVESYIDRFKNEKEIKQLSKEKRDLASILGESIYHEFKKSGTISKRFFTTNKMEELFASIEAVDKQILKLGRELDQQKK
jgi:hypothetical protein